MSDPEQSQRLARQACSTCRRQRRKCTRQLPSCQLCLKSRRLCEYPSEPDSPQSAVSDSHLPPRDPAVALFFLDSYMFRRRSTVTKAPRIQPPREILELVENEADVELNARIYFAEVHPLFPIVSKLRLLQELAAASFQPLKVDTQVLLVAMRLACQSLESHDIDEAAQASLYWKTKRALSCLEASGLLSIRLLQALLLVTYYEISNAIYPAAFMSVAVCARVGQAIGIHDHTRAPQMLPVRTSLVEHEEARRTWWAVIVLDRYVTIGLEYRPFSCLDPSADALLPMDEGSWESGEPRIRPSLAVSAEVGNSACPFARTCQAANLLSRVLLHINHRPDDYDAYYAESLILARAATAFASAMAHEADRLSDLQAAPLLPALGLAYSTQLALFDAHSCAECLSFEGNTGSPGQLEMQQVAFEGLLGLSPGVVSLARRITRLLGPGGGVRAVSPLVLDCLYQTAKQQAWYFRETNRREVFDDYNTVKGALLVAGQTQIRANEYLAILDGDDLRLEGYAP
ncbi:hypothetical protein RB595_004536 [Gaeumannomyces hyphopodioides]